MQVFFSCSDGHFEAPARDLKIIEPSLRITDMQTVPYVDDVWQVVTVIYKLALSQTNTSSGRRLSQDGDVATAYGCQIGPFALDDAADVTLLDSGTSIRLQGNMLIVDAIEARQKLDIAFQASFPKGTSIPEYKALEAQWYSSKDESEYTRRYSKVVISKAGMPAFLDSFILETLG